MTANVPVRATWKGHGQPSRGWYFGTGKTLDPARTGTACTVSYSSAGFVRFTAAEGDWTETLDVLAKFWFVRADPPAPVDASADAEVMARAVRHDLRGDQRIDPAAEAEVGTWTPERRRLAANACIDAGTLVYFRVWHNAPVELRRLVPRPELANPCPNAQQPPHALGERAQQCSVCWDDARTGKAR